MPVQTRCQCSQEVVPALVGMDGGSATPTKSTASPLLAVAAAAVRRVRLALLSGSPRHAQIPLEACP